MENQQPNQQLDPSIVNLAQAISKTETAGQTNPYTAKGGSGEYGAYQYTAPTWAADSQKYLGQAVPLDQATPAQQDEVAYNKIKDLGSQGYTPAQIASIWNSGKPDPTGNVGVNKFGVKYDTPQYVSSVESAYNQLRSGSKNPTTTPTDSTIGSSAPTTQPQENLLQKAGDVAKGVGNWAFPIVGDLYNDIKGKSDKTLLQQAGDAGLSALWFLPFGDLAEGAKAGLGAIGLGEKAAQAAGLIGTGAATGYGADVASNLSQGKTGSSIAQPGLGTAVGAALPIVGSKLDGLYNKFLGQQGVIDKVSGAWDDGLGATKKGVKAMSDFSNVHGDTPGEFLANAGITPETDEVNGRRVFTTGKDSQTYQTIQKRVNDLTNLRDSVIEKAGVDKPTSLQLVKNDMLQKAQTQFYGKDRELAVSQVNDEMDALAKQFTKDGDTISVSDLNKVKTYLQGKAKFDTAVPSPVRGTYKMMSSVAKSQAEKDAESLGIPGLSEMNKVIQQHLNFLDTNGKEGILSKLNGQTIKGGRIGKYLYETGGGYIGDIISKSLGGGAVGQVAGVLGGAKAGELLSRFMQKLAVDSPGTAATLGRMATEDPEIVKQFAAYLEKETPEEVEDTEKVAPKVIPKANKKGLISPLVTKGLIRASVKQ